MRRNALSRIEFVVALLMVAVLAGLGFSLIQRVRESAARTSCQSNLRQLALGVLNYDGVNAQLPPLVDADAGLMSVFAQLCPYLEASSRMYASPRSSAERYHAASSVSFPFTGQSGQKSSQDGGDANQIWSFFLDPADPTPKGQRDVPVTLPHGSIGYYATGNYAVNGLLAWGKKSSAKSLEEWPAPAVLFAERLQTCRTANGEVIHNLWGVGFYSPNLPAFAALTPTDPPGLQSTGQIAPATGGQFRIGRADAVPQSADFSTPIQLLRDGQPCDPRLPATPHRTGMPTAMSDGSVRVFAPNTDAETFWAACAGPPPVR
ncbi:hypothetical protein GobsT_00690 [Gemmata obscuriglobus]|uniref:DUF1559 domain-containing protein n=1 Tax=Gemmata obscuriglobus TaxID=114 RepID=A0A2Z3HC42_9BACT|nr:DUF1559 domain-containing protein [Gemmata obscuriglobus]AWM41306.1 DUF1559 domain-containing protein [Gemmata obscuriglobus]QEG25344.1 hypothetical protein GobsT_00690 [Gemmata obscuriglobus]VTR98294.1 Uncharacterized protein OS=Pirellula staleyi (strain ATCC 27377 / DSM 6068 / ICPB 4128) GN=Psta_3773 PE=4 SV=1: SBP_bac_10 [Gemmata obscuriglobus UQM 2246]